MVCTGFEREAVEHLLRYERPLLHCAEHTEAPRDQFFFLLPGAPQSNRPVAGRRLFPFPIPVLPALSSPHHSQWDTQRDIISTTMLSWLTWAQPFSKWEQGKIPGHHDTRRSTDCGCSSASAKVGMTGVEINFGLFSGLACTSRDLSCGRSRSSSYRLC
jgi:hypothetical protein